MRHFSAEAYACLIAFVSDHWLGKPTGALAAPTPSSDAIPIFLDKFALAATDLQLFSGVIQVSTKDNVFSRAYGSAVLESDTPLRTDDLLPVASNTKLFTAVAIHQLIEIGSIGWEEPVSKYVRTSLCIFVAVFSAA